MRVLHLSDFHFSKNTSWDREPVLTELVRTIHLNAQQAAIDFVVITGDIAFSGLDKEYDLALQWVESLFDGPLKTFDRDRILMVPGNHDVDRRCVGLGSQAMQEMMLEKGQYAVASVLSNKHESVAMLARLASYRKFVAKVRRDKEKLAPVWWGKVFEVEGEYVGFGGHCTCWMSSRKDEQGDLIVGDYQLNEIRQKISKSSYNISLMHHPISYLRGFDLRKTQEVLLRWYDLNLRGHLHVESAFSYSTSDKAFLELAAGSSYSGSNYPNSFHVVDVELVSKKVVVTPYVWKGLEWIHDRNLFSENELGLGVFGV